VDLAAAAAETVCQGEHEVFQLREPGRHPANHAPPDEHEESYAKAFPFDKMFTCMLVSEMIEDTAKIVNETVKNRLQDQQPRRRQRSPERREDRRETPF